MSSLESGLTAQPMAFLPLITQTPAPIMQTFAGFKILWRRGLIDAGIFGIPFFCSQQKTRRLTLALVEVPFPAARV
jgi:hypothetical protein